jgi:hypothetical protein
LRSGVVKDIPREHGCALRRQFGVFATRWATLGASNHANPRQAEPQLFPLRTSGRIWKSSGSCGPGCGQPRDRCQPNTLRSRFSHFRAGFSKPWVLSATGPPPPRLRTPPPHRLFPLTGPRKGDRCPRGQRAARLVCVVKGGLSDGVAPRLGSRFRPAKPVLPLCTRVVEIDDPYGTFTKKWFREENQSRCCACVSANCRPFFIHFGGSLADRWRVRHKQRCRQHRDV